MNIQLFSNVCRIVPTMQGWATVEKALTLASLVTALRPRNVVEIGVFAGRSAIPMALALQSNKHGTLMAIDAWSSKASVQNQTPEHESFWSHQEYHDGALQSFKNTIHQLDLTTYVLVVQSDSNDVTPPESIQLLHIDGNHSEQSVVDAARFGASVDVGGVCVVDDVTWKGADNRGPSDAIAELEKLGFKELYRVCEKPVSDNDWAVLQRVAP